MSDTEISELAACIRGGFHDVEAGGILLSSHLRWELQQMLSRVRPEDLSTTEIAALLVILMPADSRVVGITSRPAMNAHPRGSRRAPCA